MPKSNPAPQPQIVNKKKKKCFAPDSILIRKSADGELEEVPIKNIQEDDVVMCADSSGKIVFQPVVIKESHANYDGDMYEFLLEDDRRLLVTPNHGMMVDK